MTMSWSVDECEVDWSGVEVSSDSYDSGGRSDDEDFLMEESDDYVSELSDDDDGGISTGKLSHGGDLDPVEAHMDNLPKPLTTTQQADFSSKKRKNISLCKAGSAERKVYAWVWCKPMKGFYRVDIDGSIRLGGKKGGRKFKDGGYGAIARNEQGDVIAASAGISVKGPVSVFYHQFEGVRKGVQLVIDFGLPSVFLYCNSFYVRDLLVHKGNRSDYRGKDRDAVLSILDEIDKMLISYESGKIHFQFCGKGCNRAADYLSKRFKQDDITSEGLGTFMKREVISETFGEGLCVILDEDKSGAPFLYRK